MKSPQGLNIISKSERINFFTSLFENSPIPKTISSISTKHFVFVNQAWENFTGFSKEEAIGKTAFDLNLVSLENGALIREKLLNEKEIISYECSIQLKSGKEKRVLMSFSTIFIKDEAFVLNTINNLDDLQIYKEQEKILVKRSEELLIVKDFIVDSIENMTDGFVSLNTDWVYTYVNKKAANMFGKNPADLVGKHIWTEFPDGVGQPFYINYYKAVETQETISFEEYYQPWDRWFENRVIPSKEGLSIFFQDITEKKQIEIKLQENEKSLLEAQKLAKIGSYNLNLKTGVAETSNTFKEIVGLDINSEVTFDIWRTITHPEDTPNNQKVLDNSIKTGEGFVLEYRIITKNKKEIKWIEGIGEVVLKNGEATNLFGTIQDITLSKNNEIALKAAKEFSENLINSMQNGLSVIDISGKHILVNPALCNMVGYSEKELLGVTPPFPYWPPEYYDDINEIFEKTLSGIFKSGEIVFKRKNEERFPVQLTISKLNDEEGKDVAFFAAVEDISVKVKAREELKAAKEFSEKLIMSMQEGLIIVNLEGKIILVNNSTCEMLQYSKEELTGMDLPYAFAKMENFEEISRTNEKVAKGEAPAFKFEFVKKNGETFLASFLTGNIKNNKGDVIALFGTMKDISEEERAKNVLEDIAIKSTQKKDVIMELSALVGSDYHKSLQKITALSATTLNTARVGVWKFIEERTGIICEKLFVLKTGEYEDGIILNRNDNPNYFDALAENQTINVKDAVTNDITKGFAKDYLIPFGISSMLDVFIQGNQGAYGVICFEHIGKPRNWTADEQEFATSIASIVSLMVEGTQRKVAENNMVKANEQLSAANKELNALRNQLEQENVYLRKELDLVFNYEEMVYGSAAFSNVLTELEKVAPTNATVLLLGESGTGKELLARAIHNISLRNKKPLIKVNCSAIPRELIESELFGHKKGSFTGAINDKVGKFELADGGTLFLDEIGELPLDMQPKILRFLQEGEIEVVGGTGLKKLDVRVIAATNRNLKLEIEKKQFREDLYFRLNVFPIEIPPLRNRVDDIPLLTEHFVDKFNKAYAKNIKYISDDSMDQLKLYDWPGNIRELENLIERASILSKNETLLIPGFESKNQNSKLAINSKDLSLDLAQRNHILRVLEQCNWKISGPKGAAVLLNLKPSTLRDKMAKLDIAKQ